MEKIRKALSPVLCLCAALALFMAFPCPENLGSHGLVNIFENLYLSIKPMCFEMCLGFAALCFAHKRFRAGRINPLLAIVCLVIAAVWLMAQGFRIDNTLDELSRGPGQLVKCLIYLVGSYELLMLLSALILHALDSDWDMKDSRLFGFVRRHSFLSFFVIILVALAPTCIVSYPGYMCADSYCQLAYYFGIYEFVSHHPPVHTLLISLPVKLGMLMGSSNFGLFLSVCLQALVFAGVFAYMLHSMIELKAPRWLVLISFLTIVLSPNYTVVAAMILKDNMYTYGLVLFTVEVLYIFRLRGDYLKKAWHPALLFLSVMMVMLLRNNGKYLLYVFIPVLIIVMLCWGFKQKAVKKALLGALLLLLPVFSSMAVESFVVSHYDVAPGSRREALSLVFQQTARYIYERGDQVSPEERAAIDAVISYEDISTEYNPMISDPVKQYFRDECTTADLINYFKVWAKQGIRAPHVYLKATVNQNYPLVFPWKTWVCTNGYTESNQHYHISEPIGLHEVNVADGVENVMRSANSLLGLLPVPGISSSLPCCCLLLILLCVEALRRRKWLFLMIALPSLLSVGIVILAPVVDLRYAFSVVYSMSLLTALFVSPEE